MANDTIKLEKFGGMLPAWGDRLLPDGQAASSINSYLFSGELTGWRQPKLLRALQNSAAKFAYRIPIVQRARARAYLVFLSQPNPGDQITIGELTYNFTNALTNPFDVLIGATSSDTANNIVAAVTLDFNTAVNQGTLYSIGTVVNTNVSLVVGDCQTGTFNSDAYAIFVAEDYGAAQNSVRTLETTNRVRLTWLSSLDLSATTDTYANGLNPTFDNKITGDAIWLEFADQDTAVMKSPTVDDQFQRYYFSSPSEPPKYNTYDRIVSGEDPFLLGLNPPGCAPIVTVTGGGANATLGFSTNLPFTTVVGSNTVYLVPITPTGSMQLNQVNFMPQSDTTTQFAGVLYADNNGVPGELLNVGAVGAITNTGVQNSSAFLNPTGLTVGVKYWIGVIFEGATTLSWGAQPDGSRPADEGVTFLQTFSNGPPAEAPASMSTGQNNLQVWGDLTTSDVIAARSYLYTWVSAYGEESAASPSTLTNGWTNGKWHVELFSPPADDLGVDRNITKLRLYRTVSGSNSSEFFFVAELPVGTTAYDDVITDDVVALNNTITTLNFFPPPSGLHDIQSMPNGVVVGFKGNEIWFSEPYFPHAWPPGYVLTTEYPIVGLGVTGQTLVVATSATPYTAQVLHPSTATLSKGSLKEPCISHRSILSTDNGVFYMSNNGLILVTPQGTAGNVTEMWITREKWAKLVPLNATACAIPLVSCYLCFGTTNGTDVSSAQTGFLIELNQDTESFSIWPQPGGHRLGFNQLQSPNGLNIDNLLLDTWSGIGLLIQNGGIYYWDFTDQAPTMVPYTWRSKKFQANNKKNYEAMKIYFDVPTNTPAQGTRSVLPTADPAWNTLGANQYGIVRVFADDVLVTTREIYKSGELMRILSGFKAETWQFEFNARVVITNVQIATTVKQLSNM